MKKLSFLPSILIVLTIMTLGLTSCTKKYGCYYGQAPEMKVHRNVDATKWSSRSETATVETTNSNDCRSASPTVAN